MLMKPTPLTGWTQYFQWLFPFGLLLSVIFFSQEVNRLHAIYYRVEFFGEYREKVLKALPDLEKIA
jgi:uncharacterized membrane protein YbaN (DUF454 family)